MRISARLTDALGGAPCALDGDVADDDVATLGAEPSGRGCADTGRTAGHDRNPASQSLQGHSRSHLSFHRRTETHSAAHFPRAVQSYSIPLRLSEHREGGRIGGNFPAT